MECQNRLKMFNVFRHLTSSKDLSVIVELLVEFPSKI